jgi:hypothetical protein
VNVFQLIKTVLDEAYALIPGNDAAKDAAIGFALQSLSAQYQNLTIAGCLDYSNPSTRFAYIYRYTTAHANLVYTLLSRSATASQLLNRDKLTIATIGGGPGSDFLGVLKYCLTHKKAPSLKCLLLDRDPAWGESWSDVDDKLGASFRVSTVFQPFDVMQPATWQMHVKHFQADFFTMVYFMSEVFAGRTAANSYFNALFSQARPGAVFLFIDNSTSCFCDWFDAFVMPYGLNVTDRSAGVLTMPLEEEKTDLQPYYGKFSPPKLRADVAWRVAIKT